MKKILVLTICSLFFACSTSNKKYQNIDDFVGEYIAYDENKNPLLEGRTFLKIEKKEDGYHYIYPYITTRTTYDGKILEDKILSGKIYENHFLTAEKIELLKSQYKLLSSPEVIEKNIINLQEAGILYDSLDGTDFELYKVKKGEKYTNKMANGDEIKGETLTDLYTKFNLHYYIKILSDDPKIKNLDAKIIFLEKIK